MITTERSPNHHRGHKARSVADNLRREATRGAFSAGVPPEDDLAAQYGVSRNVVRVALRQLSAEGLIIRRPGHGTSVTHPKAEYRIDELRGLQESFHTGTVVNDVREVALIPAPPVVAWRLDVEQGSPVLFIERLRTIDGAPYSLDRTYLVQDAGEGIEPGDLGDTDVFTLLENALGTSLGDSEYLIEATTADAHSAELLDLPAAAPLILMERLTSARDGRPVDLEFISLRGDRASLRARGTRPPHTR